MTMATCSKCGTSYPSNVHICTQDGTVLGAEGNEQDAQAGKVLDGKYRLDAYLSHGGMGYVYRATHIMLDKVVAVKLIEPELVTSPDVVRRFQREARAASNLNHPNIVSVYDLGQTDEGTLYIAMELIDGPSLKDVIRNGGPMEPSRIVRILREVGSALSLAHKNNIIHRDLKPHNIMLATDSNGQEQAKLLDFGIAKTFDEAATKLTMTGFVLGTPQYMAPEQASGTTVDGRTDLYSLGVILYEMLSGELPFNEESTPAILIKHMTEVPQPPSRRKPGLAISPGLEAIALKCLEKEPAKRFESADALVQALNTVDLSPAASSAFAPTMPLPTGSGSQGAMPPTAGTRPPAAMLSGSGASQPAATTGRPTQSAPTTTLPRTATPAPAPKMPTAPLAAEPAAAGTIGSGAAAAAATAVKTPTIGAPPTAVEASASPSSGTHPTVPAASATGPVTESAPKKSGGGMGLWLGLAAVAVILVGVAVAMQGGFGFGGSSTGADSTTPQASPALADTQAPNKPPADPAANTAAAAQPAATALAPAAAPGSAQPAPPAAPTAQTSPAAQAPVTQASSGGGGPRNAQTASAGQASAAARSSSVQPGLAAVATGGAAGPAAAASTRAAASQPAAPNQPVSAQPSAASQVARNSSAPAAQSPVRQALPENPPVLFRCSGAPEICGSVRSHVDQALERGHLPSVGTADRAAIIVNANASIVQERVSHDFGTPLAARTYSVDLSADSREGDVVPMPAPRTFSFDATFGRDRLDENARLIADDVVERVRAFWKKRLQQQ
jgi:serine/threonine-protein kinase